VLSRLQTQGVAVEGQLIRWEPSAVAESAGADVLLVGRDQCRPDHEPRWSFIGHHGTVVPVLQRHMLMEATAHAGISWRRRQDRADRRVGDGQGQVSLRMSAARTTAMGVRRQGPALTTSRHTGVL